jgi:hypothetical protein
MHVSFRVSLALCAALCLAVLGSTDAQAAPITVNLRVEGSSGTLYEGPITTEAEEISTPSSGGSHSCDVKDNGSNEGFGVSSGTPTTALHDAAVADGLKFDATWSNTYNDFLVTEVGLDINGGEPEYPSWGYAVNYTTAGVGGCQFQVAPGSEVLWAYDYSNLKHLLSLTGPASASVGSPITIHVVDGQTGIPVAGAAIGEDLAGVTTTIPGSTVTNAEGNATVTFTHVGAVKLKATQAESVRSNGLSICVHNGNDGTCGTQIPPPCATESVPAGACGGPPIVAPQQSAATALAAGVKAGHVYSRRKAPRILKGAVTVPAGGTLKDVRVSLERRSGKRCFAFNGVKERFVKSRCGATKFFSVGDSESFSYLLPAALPAGRYVYDIEAVNASGQPTKLVAGVSHVVFYVK